MLESGLSVIGHDESAPLVTPVSHDEETAKNTGFDSDCERMNSDDESAPCRTRTTPRKHGENASTGHDGAPDGAFSPDLLRSYRRLANAAGIAPALESLP